MNSVINLDDIACNPSFYIEIFEQYKSTISLNDDQLDFINSHIADLKTISRLNTNDAEKYIEVIDEITNIIKINYFGVDYEKVVDYISNRIPKQTPQISFDLGTDTEAGSEPDPGFEPDPEPEYIEVEPESESESESEAEPEPEPQYQERPQVTVTRERPQVTVTRERPQVTVAREQPQVTVTREQPRTVTREQPRRKQPKLITMPLQSEEIRNEEFEKPRSHKPSYDPYDLTSISIPKYTIRVIPPEEPIKSPLKSYLSVPKFAPKPTAVPNEKSTEFIQRPESPMEFITPSGKQILTREEYETIAKIDEQIAERSVSPEPIDPSESPYNFARPSESPQSVYGGKSPNIKPSESPQSVYGGKSPNIKTPDSIATTLKTPSTVNKTPSPMYMRATQ